MPKNKLTFEKKIQAITLIEEKYSLWEVTAKLERNINYTTILQLYKKYKQTGSVDNKLLLDHLQKLAECDKQFTIRKILRRECNITIDVQKSLKTNINIDISANTIHRTLKKYRLVSKVKRKKTLLFKKYCKTWLDFVMVQIIYK